ncbi:hypothetical protein IF2G_07604 [Cordyceps javanica]|nr:hypothetical protein IF2G_07604 [Cordyceps javanica]
MRSNPTPGVPVQFQCMTHIGAGMCLPENEKEIPARTATGWMWTRQSILARFKGATSQQSCFASGRCRPVDQIDRRPRTEYAVGDLVVQVDWERLIVFGAEN